MASAALPPNHPPPPSHNTPPESPLSRMAPHHHHHHHNQFNFPNNSAGGPSGPPPPASSGPPPAQEIPDSFGSYSGDPFYAQEATSGSNSADEEESSLQHAGAKRALNGGGEILGHHHHIHSHHHLSSSNKKRRKQSKPLRLTGEGSNEEAGDEERRYSTEDEEAGSSISSGNETPAPNANTTDGRSRPGDSPLNLSSGGSSSATPHIREPGEKGPSLRVLGPELMSPEFESGELISKLGLPSNSSSSLYQAAAAAAAGMLPFGLGGSHFPFPFPPKSAAGLPGGPPRSSQIFNPEAYCELCNKEFCNKYFLKTHKANKHGIYTEATNSTSTSSNGPSETNTPTTINTTSSSSNNNNNISSSSSSGAPKSHHGHTLVHPNSTTSSTSGSPFSGAFIAANMATGRAPPPFIPLSPPSHSSPSPANKSLEDRGGGSPGMLRPGSNGENGELRRSLESPLGGGRLPPLLFGSSKDHSDRIPAKSSFSQEKLRQMGVINADAFCEICCKEFCNKYFLRVHKLKKHGICSPDLPPEKVQKILSQMAKEAGKTGQPPPQLVRPPVSSTGSSPMMIPPPSPKSPPGGRPRGSHTPSEEGQKDGVDEGLFGRQKMVDLEEEEEGELIKKSSSEDLQRLQSMIMELNAGKGGDSRRGPHEEESNNSSSVCKICSKDMDNKFFLRAHLMNEHGIFNHPEESLLLGHGFKENPFLQHGFLENTKSSMDFTNKFLQQMTKGLSTSNNGSSSSSEEERNYLERVKNELAAGGLSPRKLLESKDPNRRPASLSRSYCEICKKELCNKYFMKTHMMKMHGINIDGATGGGSGSSPGLSGVSCHICKKELCSKYFLKVHLQNSHGLSEDGQPLGHPPPSSKENGSAASSLFPSLFPPPPPEFPEKDPQYFSRLLGEQSEKLKQQQAAAAAASKAEEAPFTCPFCGEDLKELVLLQVHIIRSHGTFPPDLSGDRQRRRDSLFSGAREDDDEEDFSHRSRDDEDKSRSLNNNNNNDHEEEDKSEVGSPKTPPRGSLGTQGHPPPSKASPSSSLSSNEKASSPPEPPPTSSSSSSFPNIEMLQRHMLSTQFPGLINPLLSGLAAGGSLSFPIQKLLGSSSSPPPVCATPEAGKTAKTASSETTTKGTRRIFKCPKCNQRFKRRELCLSHLTSEHGLSIRRKLRFSPLKGSFKKTHRSEYVRHFMELLKFPTSRARARSNSDKKSHIMQPFLLKTPGQGEDSAGAFVPSLVYLPVERRVSGPLTVAFNLIPA